ncbi:MAG: magnesium/cobalt transporter CorA [Acidobacteria bacterium]|nr:magnesium/cobalt transporter CorA [Acidobacteriota bacterium]
MDIFVYRPGSQKVEEGYTVAQLPELLRDESLTIWVDMDKPTEEVDDRTLLEVFKFHPLSVEDCRADRHHPKVEEFPDYLYFILHGVTAKTDSEHFNTIELDGFLGRNFVVTYHHEMFRSINQVKESVRSTPSACQRGASYLLYQILDRIVDYYTPVLDDFDENIVELEDRIFSLKTPDNAILEQIQHLKRSVLRLRRISSKQLNIIYRISHGEFQLIPQEMLPFFRDIHDHLTRIADLSESYRDLIGGALDSYLSVVSNRTNDIMKVLTIFSAVMLPLTFIAGLYGMNFDNQPELHYQYSYYVVIGVMVLVALAMLFLFWRMGWIGRQKREDEGGKVS